jgi:hypothetical protein
MTPGAKKLGPELYIYIDGENVASGWDYFWSSALTI